MGFQNDESFNFGNFRTFDLGVLKNDIWLLLLRLITENNIRRKVVVSPKFGPWWVLWIRVCPWFVRVHQKCSNYALINLLFGLCKFIWIIDSLVICSSPHPRAPTHPFYLRVKCCGLRNVTLIPFSVIFIFGFAFESFKDCGGASRK